MEARLESGGGSSSSRGASISHCSSWPHSFSIHWHGAAASPGPSVSESRSYPDAPSWRRALNVSVVVLLGPIVAVATFFPFVLGYGALFQANLHPMPASYPGPLDRREAFGAQPPLKLPTIIFILSDDHRWDFTGYARHPFVETPALDRLAAEGLRFERAYVSSSLCSPSRASFLTGVHPHRHGVWDNDSRKTRQPGASIRASSVSPTSRGPWDKTRSENVHRRANRRVQSPH